MTTFVMFFLFYQWKIFLNKIKDKIDDNNIDVCFIICNNDHVRILYVKWSTIFVIVEAFNHDYFMLLILILVQKTKQKTTTYNPHAIILSIIFVIHLYTLFCKKTKTLSILCLLLNRLLFSDCFLCQGKEK
jgi:hypothetical protein